MEKRRKDRWGEYKMEKEKKGKIGLSSFLTLFLI